MPTIRFNPKKETKLTPKQEEVIAALAECLDVGEASKKTGVPSGTIRSWLRQALFLLTAQKAGYTAINIFAKKNNLSPEQVREFEKKMDESIANWEAKRST